MAVDKLLITSATFVSISSPICLNLFPKWIIAFWLIFKVSQFK